MANVEESVYSDPNFAVICSFLEKFGDFCGIPGFTIVTLQEMLEDTRNVHPDLVDLHVKLLRRSGKKSVTHDKWEKVLVKYCHGYSKVDAWEIERFGYKKAKLGVKISLLKRLLEAQFDTSSKFKTDINKLSSEQLRLLPIGKDLKGLMYWFQLDQDLNLRIYCEDQDEETWDLVVRERGELVSLIQNLETNGNPGLKKEEDSTTPSDTGESKDGDGSLGIQVIQEKREDLPEEKLQFRVPLLTSKEEGKLGFEGPLVQEENKLLIKHELMETDVAQIVDSKEDITLKVEKCESQDSSVSDVPSVEMKEAEMTIKIKEEPMLIDEDTIVEPKILERNGGPLQAESTPLPISEIIGFNAKLEVEDQEQNKEPAEMENGTCIGEAVLDLSSSVRASVIKLAEKPTKVDTASNNVEAVLPGIVPQTLTSSAAKHSQEEATDLTTVKRNDETVECDSLENIPLIKDSGPVVVAVAQQNDGEKSLTKDLEASGKPVLPAEIIEKVVREPIKHEQELSDRDRCERMKMPLKKRNIPKDLDTGDSRPIIVEKAIKCEIPLNMELTPLQSVENESDVKISNAEVKKIDIAITSPLPNHPEPNVPTDTIPISGQITVDPVDAEVTVRDKLESAPSNSDKSSADVPEAVLTKNENLDNLSIELIDTGQTLALVERDSTPDAIERRQLSVAAKESSETVVNAESNDVDTSDLKVAKLRLKKNVDGSAVIDVPEKQTHTLQPSDDLVKEDGKPKTLSEESESQILERTNQADELITESADRKNVEEETPITKQIDIVHLSSTVITEGLKEVEKVKVITEKVMESIATSITIETVEKLSPRLESATKTDKENEDFPDSKAIDTSESVKVVRPDKCDEAVELKCNAEDKTENVVFPVTVNSSLVKMGEKDPSIKTLQKEFGVGVTSPELERIPEQGACSDSHQSDMRKAQRSEQCQHDDLPDCKSIQNKKIIKPFESSKDQSHKGSLDLSQQNTIEESDRVSTNTRNLSDRTTEELSDKKESSDCINILTNASEPVLSESKRTQGSENQRCKKEKCKSEDGLNGNSITEKEFSSEDVLIAEQKTVDSDMLDGQLVSAAKDLAEKSSDSTSVSDPIALDDNVTKPSQDEKEKNESEKRIEVVEANDNSNYCHSTTGDCVPVPNITPVKPDLKSQDSIDNTKSVLNDSAVIVKKKRRSRKAKMLADQENQKASLPDDSGKIDIEASSQNSTQSKPHDKVEEISDAQEIAANTNNNDLPNEAEIPVPERRMTRSLRPRPGQPAVIAQPARKERKKPGPKSVTVKQKKETLNELEPKVPKRMGRPPKGTPKPVKVVKPTPNKGRGRKKATVECLAVESSDDIEEVIEAAITPTKKRKLESSDLEEDSYSSIKRSPRLRAQRQKVRSEQQLIEEEMQRRALVAKVKRPYKKKKLGLKLSGKGQEKRESGKKEVLTEEEVETVKGRKKLKKKKHISSKRRKKGTNPWDVSSESTSASSEPEERNEEVEDEDEELVFNDGSDHEFSPESEPEDEDPNYVPMTVKRARTVKQAKTGSGEESSSSEDDKPCNKCGKYDHPEWILLCDKCDCGYHTSCLRPPLLVIPDGDWYCPPCGHKILVERLHEQLKNLDQLLKKKDRDEMRKKRLAYVGISLDNVLKPEKEKKESVGDEEELEEERDEGDSDDDYTLLRKRSKRQRKEVSYRFKEFDELIKSAIHDEPVLDSLETGVTGIGKGKDMSNITDVPPEESEFDIISNRKKRKHRRLNDLDTSTEEEDDSDEDFKGTSTNSEQITEEESGGAHDDSDDSWQGEHRSGRSHRRGRRHDDSDFINDSDLDSDDNRRTVRRAAAKSVNYRELSDSDDGGQRRKRIDNTRSKSSRGAISDDSEEESEDSDWKKSKKHSSGSSKSKQRTGRKAWRIDSDDDNDDNDDDDEEEEKDSRHRHTRGKKTSYEEVQYSSNSEEEVKKSKKNSRLKIGDFAKDSEDEQSSSEDDTDEEEEDEEIEEKETEKVEQDDKVKGEDKVSKDAIEEAKNKEGTTNEGRTSPTKVPQEDVSPAKLIPKKFCETESLNKEAELKSKLAEPQPKESCETDVSPVAVSQPAEIKAEKTPAVPTPSEKLVESRTSTSEADKSDAAEITGSPTEPEVVAVKATEEETLKTSVIKSVESVKKEMLEGTKAPSPKSENKPKDSALQKKQEAAKSPADEPPFMDRVRPVEFPDRPSPLKPSAVEPYPVESSPSKLMLLDTYPPVRGSPQSKLTPLEPYSSSAATPPYDRPRMAGPGSHFHADYGNYPGQYYSPNYPPPSSQYSPSPPMPAYQSSPNPYPPFQQPSPNYGYMPQGYGEQGPYHGPPQQYGPYGNYSPPPQPPPAGPPPQPQPNGRFTIDNLLQRRMEGASEDDDFSTVNDLVSYITGSSSATSQENPL